MKSVRAIIFDMDGVIFDSESLWKKMFLEANKKYGLNLDERYRQSICGKTEMVIRDELKKLIPELDSDEYRNYIINGVEQSVQNGDFDIQPGALELLNFAKNNGYKTALATSSARIRAEGMFRKKNLDEKELFQACIYGDEIGSRSKPDPYIFELAAEKLGIEKSECIVVEDSLNGIKAAVNGGFLPVMAVDLIEPDYYCLSHCWKIVNSLNEFVDFLGDRALLKTVCI